MWADIVMGLIQLISAGFLFISVKLLYKQKVVRGVSSITVGFWVAWGLWDLYYFPSLGQWFAFSGSVAITILNSVYVYLILHYNYKEKYG